MISEYNGKYPEIKQAAFIAWNADVSGDVVMGKDSSVWFSSTLRGDIARITLGERTNIQDNSALHTDSKNPLQIGAEVTAGHGVILHGCIIKDRCMIGMGAIILSGAIIEEESIVAAGSVIPEGKKYPPRSLIMGIPGKVVRSLTEEEVESNRQTAERYVHKARETRKIRGE